MANAPWSAQALLETVRRYVLPVMGQKGPVVAWIADDTGLVKEGIHSVGVVRQYCGQLGKRENCRVAVSLSVATERASLPITWRLYLPEVWAGDRKRRAEAGIPEEVSFATQPAIALGQIGQAAEQGVPRAPVLADAAYGNDHQFREGLRQWGLEYVVGIPSLTTVWRAKLRCRPSGGKAGDARPDCCVGDPQHQPVTVKELAQGLPSRAWRSVCWREGARGNSAHASPPGAFGSPIGIMGEADRIWKSGY